MKSPELRTDAGLEGAITRLPIILNHLKQYTCIPRSPVFEPNGSISYIYMFAVIALMILIIACANYTNLATAQSAGRSERLVCASDGARLKKQVFLQFI